MPALPTPDIGVFLPSMSGAKDQPGDMTTTARHAEDLGLESAWVVDQLVAGTGAPLIESVVSLAAAAGATTRIRLGLGVMILPLRPVVWAAKQVASLQHASHDRLILGVGAGGDRHDRSWIAAGVPRRERGRRTDAALRVLPALVSGLPTRLGSGPDSPAIRLAPAATVPPILVGGMSEAAMVRTAEHGDGWFVLPVSPAAMVDGRARLADLANTRGRPTPSITASMVAALTGDPTYVHAIDTIWTNTVSKKLYITGGIGASGLRTSSMHFDRSRYAFLPVTRYNRTSAISVI